MAQVGYAAIAEHYRRGIQDGVLAPGDAMPSLQEVCEQFGVDDTTAGRAYRVLKAEGLTLPGRDAAVVVSGPISNNVSARVRLHRHTGTALGGGETSRVLETGTVGADELVAARLDVTPGTPVHVRRRVVSRDGTPIHISSSYYPAYVIAATPELTEPVSTGGSRELAAERLGMEQDHVLEEVTSRLPTPAEKDVLGLTESGAVVSQVIRTVRLADGRVVEVAVKVTGGSTVLRWSGVLRSR
ncbi:GntR family transcriptional regulator [Streptomyces sp. NPDC003691]